MASNTPLITDVKSDQSLPVYRIDESSEELIVGGRGPCAWARRWRARCAERCAERRARGQADGCAKTCGVAGRIIKWIFAIALFFGVARFFAIRHFTASHHATCVPINSTTTTLTLPFVSEHTGVYLHPSLVTGNTHIIHSTDASNGTILVSFDLTRDPSLAGVGSAEELFVCSIVKPYAVGVGIFTRDRKSAVPAVRFATVEIPEGVPTPSVKLIGATKHSCMKKALRKHIVNPAIARFDAEHAEADWVNIDEDMQFIDEDTEDVKEYTKDGEEVLDLGDETD